MTAAARRQPHVPERTLRELALIFDTTTDFMVQTDWRGGITYMNAAARDAVGIARDAPVDAFNFSDFATASTSRRFAEVIGPAVNAHGVWVGETTVRTLAREELPVSHLVIAHRDATGRIDRYSGVMRDISADVDAKRELQRQAAALYSVTESFPAMVAVVGSDGRYRLVNSRFEQWHGLKREQIVGTPIDEVLGPLEYRRRRPWIDRALRGETVSFDQDYPARPDWPHLSINYIPLLLDNGAVDGFVVVAQDVTHQRREAIRLQEMVQRDALTGLLNRTGFEQHLDARLLDGSGPRLALLYIDLDHFKPVNDAHGHATGDQVLQVFAQRLARVVRPGDSVARLGGDEFAILLAGMPDSASAESVAAKVIAAAQAPFEIGSLLLQIGASVGLAYGAAIDRGACDFVGRADAQLYRAKHAGRGCQAKETAG